MKEEKEYVDGYELHALGWLFWLDFFTVSESSGLEIADHRADLFGKELEARSRIDPIHNMFTPRRIQFTGEVVASVKKLLRLMMQLHPERFGTVVLLRRRRYFGIVTLLSLLLCFISAEFLSPAMLWKGEIVLTFFILTFLSTLPLIVLFRVTGMIKRLKFEEE